MTVDRDMFMALGIEQDALAPIDIVNSNGNGNGNGNGSTEGLMESSGERDWTELDFDCCSLTCTVSWAGMYLDRKGYSGNDFNFSLDRIGR
jgi:hypothetical protein